MGLFDNIRKKETIQQKVNDYFKMINAYTPAFTSFEGSVYEMELTRAAIHSFANHCSKLKAEVSGSNNEMLARTLQYFPNRLMDAKKYMYRLATSVSIDNTAFTVPLTNGKGEIYGFYPLIADKCQIVELNGQQYLRYDFGGGKYGAIELEKAGILNQFQYKNELYGESNRPLKPTLDMYSVQNQAISEGAKNSAAIRFIAKLGMALKDEDLKKERERFTSSNLMASNNGGVLLIDQKYADVKQIDSRPYVVNPTQVAQIKENVFSYFGTNENIIQNNYTSEQWNAYYEGKIEPFALECGLVHTRMCFSDREVAFGNEIIFTANRLQYLNNNEKLQTVTSLFDRGMLTQNEAREIFNMSKVEDGDKFYIRKEYAEYNGMEGVEENATDEGQTIQNDVSADQTNGSGDGTEEL